MATANELDHTWGMTKVLNLLEYLGLLSGGGGGSLPDWFDVAANGPVTVSPPDNTLDTLAYLVGADGWPDNAVGDGAFVKWVDGSNDGVVFTVDVYADAVLANINDTGSANFKVSKPATGQQAWLDSNNGVEIRSDNGKVVIKNTAQTTVAEITATTFGVLGVAGQGQAFLDPSPTVEDLRDVFVRFGFVEP